MYKIGLLLFITFVTLSADIGTITALHGEATLIHDGKTQGIKVGSILSEHDEIHTGKNTKLQILFVDKTVISLGQKTDFKIDAYLNDDKNPQARFSVGKGFFKSITGHIGKIAPRKFKIKTANATIGVRGTTVIGEVQAKRDIIACTSGQIVVSTAQGKMVVNAGERTIVDQMKGPRQSQKVNRVLLQQLDSQSDPSAETVSVPEVMPSLSNTSKDKAQENAELEKVSDDFSPWEEDTTGIQTLLDIEQVLGEKRPQYRGQVLEGSTNYGKIDKASSDVRLGFDLGTGKAQGSMHIEDAQSNVHDIDISGKLKGDGNFELNSNNGYGGGAKGSLSGARLGHANGDFNFNEKELGGQDNHIKGKFETRHQK